MLPLRRRVVVFAFAAVVVVVDAVEAEWSWLSCFIPPLPRAGSKGAQRGPGAQRGAGPEQNRRPGGRSASWQSPAACVALHLHAASASPAPWGVEGDREGKGRGGGWDGADGGFRLG